MDNKLRNLNMSNNVEFVKIIKKKKYQKNIQLMNNKAWLMT